MAERQSSENGPAVVEEASSLLLPLLQSSAVEQIRHRAELFRAYSEALTPLGRRLMGLLSEGRTIGGAIELFNIRKDSGHSRRVNLHRNRRRRRRRAQSHVPSAQEDHTVTGKQPVSSPS